MRLIYMIAADVLRALGWEVEINEKDSYWNLVLTNTTSSEDMPESHKSCLRGLLRGWLMEFNYEGGRQQVNIYKEPIVNPNAKTVETVTQDEYFREVSTLNGKIRELEQLLKAEQQENSRQQEITVEFLRKSESCLDAVSAMLECSGGATHRMRNFYAGAMQKFIDNAKKILRKYADPKPF